MEASRGPASVLLTPQAGPVKLIVCERSGGWAVGLRRELTGSGVRVYETRTLAACWQMLEESPAGLAVVEWIGSWADELLRRMARLQREFPLARVAVVADRVAAGYEWLLREAGAVHFTCSPRQLGPLARSIRRHLDQAPALPRTLTEQIWEGLPWGGGMLNDEC